MDRTRCKKRLYLRKPAARPEPPPQRVHIPKDVYLTGFSYELYDAAGDETGLVTDYETQGIPVITAF